MRAFPPGTQNEMISCTMHCESCRHIAPDVVVIGDTIVARCPMCSKTVEYIYEDGEYRFKDAGSCVRRVSDDG